MGDALPWPALVLVLAPILLPACRAPASPAAATARAWGNGPARWLLLDDEQQALGRVRTNTDFASFLGAFWACRDDDPATDENPFGRLFAERGAAADRLYAEPGVRGSLTPRGGALLLLGPPT
ncbi:MAG TPA: GWxTD domain-containing protein, partial [Thermoanaerobaculia bacterium]|nr:GWxTD domain-containing protein [Thermoanaerobaculia bacterium]